MAKVPDDTVFIDGQIYDRQQVYDWLARQGPIPADCIPLDGVRNLDREAGTVEVKFMACDKDGNWIIDPVRNCFMQTEWMGGRYAGTPPEPLNGASDAA